MRELGQSGAQSTCQWNPELVREIAERHLPKNKVQRYVEAATAQFGEQVAIYLRPERWPAAFRPRYGRQQLRVSGPRGTQMSGRVEIVNRRPVATIDCVLDRLCVVESPANGYSGRCRVPGGTCA